MNEYNHILKFSTKAPTKDVIFAIHIALQIAEEQMIADDSPFAHIIYDIRNNEPTVEEIK